MARYVRRRVGPHEFIDLVPLVGPDGATARVLDLGCGLGRHIVLAHELGLDGYGIDVSARAIEKARAWLAEISPRLPDHAIVGDVRELPWPNAHFSVVISHGVLDSMPFTFAAAAAREVHRVLEPGGYFYCDLIAPDAPSGAAEIDVSGAFEAGTVQSYFTEERIADLVGSLFDVVDQIHIRTRHLPARRTTCRWHLVLRRGQEG